MIWKTSTWPSTLAAARLPILAEVSRRRSQASYIGSAQSVTVRVVAYRTTTFGRLRANRSPIPFAGAGDGENLVAATHYDATQLLGATSTGRNASRLGRYRAFHG